MHVNVHLYGCVYVYVCMYVCMYLCMCIWMGICIDMYMRMCINMCMCIGLVETHEAFALSLGALATFARWLSGRRLSARLGLKLPAREAQGAATVRTVRRCH